MGKSLLLQKPHYEITDGNSTWNLQSLLLHESHYEITDDNSKWNLQIPRNLSLQIYNKTNSAEYSF